MFFSFFFLLISQWISNVHSIRNSQCYHPNTSSYSQIVYVTAVIDAETVCDVYKTSYNSIMNHRKDIPRAIANHFGYLITEQKYKNDSHCSAVLAINVKMGDSIRFSAISQTNNYEHVVVLSGVSKSDYWTNPQFNANYERNMAFPTTVDFIDFNVNIQNYFILDVQLLKGGVISYTMVFALYERLNTINHKFQLIGFFEWTPTLIITLN